MNRPKRVIRKPERFSDIQQSLSIGKYNGHQDTYVRAYVQKELLINTNVIKNSLCGYDHDEGFVVNESLTHLKKYGLDDESEEEFDEDEESDDDDESDDDEESDDE